jgi:ankyrin repeat and BTB/POZ domain-containing protein 1
LISYDYSKSTDPLQPWSSHITSLLAREAPNTSDISLQTNNDSFQLHKFLLSSRTPYFRRKLADAPETRSWRLSDSIPVEAFHVVMKYLYLDEIPRDIVDPRGGTSEEEVFKGIDKISKQLEVEKLWEAVLAIDDRRLSRQRYQDEVERAQRQIEGFFREHVLGHKMVVETQKAGEVRWNHDNFIFADCLLRADEANEEGDPAPHADDPQQLTNGIPVGPGSVKAPEVKVLKPKRSVLYPVHKALLIRSPYFETMFSSRFIEAQPSEHLHIIKVDCIPEVLEIVLTFMYTERVDCPLHLALDLLYAADMLFLDKLKSKAAVAISTLGSGNNNVLVDRTHPGAASGEQQEIEVEPINVYDVIRAAWDLNVQRLEEFAARYIAYRLEDYIDEVEFAELIRESAARVKNRQETDTIELLDDIRYYLSERFRLRFEEAGLEELLDEDGEITAETAGILASRSDREAAKESDSAAHAAVSNPGVSGGVVRTLDGDLVEDEFDQEARNYQILLGKIEVLLERLKLDA